MRAVEGRKAAIGFRNALMEAKGVFHLLTEEEKTGPISSERMAFIMGTTEAGIQHDGDPS